jgi:dTMP kinase
MPNQEEMWVLKNCKFARYVEAKKRPRTVSIAIFRTKGDRVQVLIGQRSNPPAQGEWALPGGHVEDDEKLVDAAKRELQEETGVKVDDLVFIERKIRHPGEKERIDSIFCQEVPEDTKIEASSDLAKVKWVDTDDLPALAFNHDESILISQKKLLETKKEAAKARKGILVVVEGVDGAGKSTVIGNLEHWLERCGYAVTVTRWGDSEVLKKAIRKAKDNHSFVPLTYSLIHAADMIDRFEKTILPALARNEIVICDRYYYTSMVRDSLRKVSVNLIESIYKDLPEPDVLFHCDLPVKVAVERVLNKKGLSYYGSGMDLELADDKETSCRKYEELMDKEYRKILPTCKSYVSLDSEKSEDDVMDQVKDVMRERFDVEDA